MSFIAGELAALADQDPVAARAAAQSLCHLSGDEAHHVVLSGEGPMRVLLAAGASDDEASDSFVVRDSPALRVCERCSPWGEVGGANPNPIQDDRLLAAESLANIAETEASDTHTRTSPC